MPKLGMVLIIPGWMTSVMGNEYRCPFKCTNARVYPVSASVSVIVLCGVHAVFHGQKANGPSATESHSMCGGPIKASRGRRISQSV